LGDVALGVTENALPLQVCVVMLAILGLGLTVIVMVNVEAH
jgi:hypothetical protein